MAERKDHDPKKDEAVPANRPAPDSGALKKDDIKSIDLDPRSNGETDWQGDIPKKKGEKEG